MTMVNKKTIHSAIVTKHLAKRKHNKILQAPPPNICSCEETLPRHTRRTLAQPRTNWPPFLKSLLHKINAHLHRQSNHIYNVCGGGRRVGCVVLCIVRVMRPYTEGRLDCSRIGIHRELSEIRTQPRLSEGSLTCDPCHHSGSIFLIARRRNSTTSVLVSISRKTCLSTTCEPRTIDYWRAHHVCYVASQPRTSDHLISHWRALCLLAYDNWRCSIQPEIFHSSKCRARAGIRTLVDSGRVSYANR